MPVLVAGYALGVSTAALTALVQTFRISNSEALRLVEVPRSSPAIIGATETVRPGMEVTTCAGLDGRLFTCSVGAATVTGKPLPPATIPEAAATLGQAPQRRAMVIVIEENEHVSHSVTWSGLSQNLIAFDYSQTVPVQLRPFVDGLVALLAPFGISAAAVADEISSIIGPQVARALGQHAAAAAQMAGLPQGGCARQIFDAVAAKGVQTGDDPFRVFLNEYGETAMANCLRDMALAYYDTVLVLNDQDASLVKFREALLDLHQNNFVTDIFLNVHGCGVASGPFSAFNNTDCGYPPKPHLGFTDAHVRIPDLQNIRELNNGQPLNINAIYQTPCWSSEFSQAWLGLGARAANGPRELNYYVLLSPFVFVDRFTRGGRTMHDAPLDAYGAERWFFNGPEIPVTLDLRPFLDAVVPRPLFGPDPVAQACGGSRDQCARNFTLTYGPLVGHLLSGQGGYGFNPALPVHHAASSERIHMGDGNVRRALSQ